jgi:hypothetical protein
MGDQSDERIFEAFVRFLTAKQLSSLAGVIGLADRGGGVSVALTSGVTPRY